MKAVKANHEKEVEPRLDTADSNDPALRQNSGRDFFPSRAPRVPPPTVRALLEARRLAGNDKTHVPVDIGLELVATPRKHDEVRNLLRALVELPVLFVAQRSRRQSVRACDLIVVRDDGVAGYVQISRHE